MKNGNVVAKKSKGIFRSISIGSLSVSVVLIMVLSVLMPTVGAAAPDLSIDPMDVTVGPEPLVEGVPATVNFLVWNLGDQNAFGFNVSLYDHGKIVADKYTVTMSIGDFTNVTLDWTPKVPGSYNLMLRAWYGPSSAKQDLDWDNNNVSIPVVVDSRPDVYLYSGDITYTAPDPNYVVDGDSVTIRAVIHNSGTADVVACNVSLYEGRVGGSGELIATLTDITVAGQGQATVPIVWNTTGFSGRRAMFVYVWGVDPTETELYNNMASITIKIHTKEDRVFDGADQDITSPYKIQFFITVKSSTTLTITETGNATVYQDFSEQYDIELMDKGQLVIMGGKLNSQLNYTIRMMDQSELHLIGAVSNVRIIATGNCNVTIEDSIVGSPTIEMNGGFLTITEGSRITADRLVLSSTIVNVANSIIDLDETIRVDGRTASFTDTEITVSRDYDTYTKAQDAFPQLEFHDPETRETPGLPSALVAANGAVVDLLNVSAQSSVYVIDEDNHFWTDQTLASEGRTSLINVNRYLVIEVRDWFGEIIPDAQVIVLDYFDELIITSGTTDEMGNVRLAVKTDYITSALKPFVGNLRLRASAHGKTSEDYRIAHNKYPQMDFDSNTMNVTIEMPPNPYGDYGRHVLYNTDHVISGLESGMDKNIIIDNGALTLRDTTFSLEQEFPFQWFVLIKGDHGVLKLVNATMWSDYPFKIYLEESGTLNMTTASALYDVRIIAEDTSTLQVIGDSIVWGGIYTDCGAIEFVTSAFHLSHTRLEASTVSITGGYIRETDDLLIRANDVLLANVELTAEYEFYGNKGVDSLADLFKFFGWAALNDMESLTNRSNLFSYFAIESNITIDTQRLTMSGAFIYAVETNILVRRSPLPKQTNIEGSDIGGMNLTIISDDMTAVDCSFNRALDNFGSDNGIDDKITLISVDVPGIVCSDGATVNRFWSLTVIVTDGAGSLRPKALLEVFSTETNDRLLPATGQEDLDSSRTNADGILTVRILANVTDNTGDYFVGSVYFWLMYDGPQFSDDPVFTPTLQVNLKSDMTIPIGFKEVIAPLEKDIIFALYNAEDAGESLDVKVYNHTFGGYNEAAAELFLNQTAGLDPDRIRFNWTIIRNTTMEMTFYTSAQINNIWEPLRDGRVLIYLLETPFPSPNNIATDWEGKNLNWSVTPDINGEATLTIRVPDELGTFQLYISISGGDFDPAFEPITHRFMNLVVEPPQTIQIISARIQEFPIRVGDGITVQGSVRYIYTDLPVILAEIEVEGSHVSPGHGLTDSEGRFTINLQAPLMPQDNISLEIIATDPSSDEKSAIIVPYTVEPPEEEITTKDFPWGWVMVGIIAAVIAFAIALGAVMMYRKHYGEVVECGECGAFIASSSTACPKCGIEFETDLARCSECEAWIPANSSSCPVCGTAFTIQSLEEQVAKEEADEDIAPIDQVTTSTSQMAPLTLEGSSGSSKWGDKEDKRRRRIKKRVKKRLTVTDGGDLEAAAGSDEAKDLFIGDEDEMSTRLPGLGVDESMLSDDELSRLLPTEDMLKELMLTSEDVPTSEVTEEMEGEEEADEADAGSEPEEAPDDEEGTEAAEAAEDLEDISLEEGDMDDLPMEDDGMDVQLEEIPPPEDGEIHEDLILPDEEDLEGDPDTEVAEEEDLSPEEMDEGRVLLSELGLVADSRGDMDLDIDDGDDSRTMGALAEEKAKEAPKLCPNCGGNWILYKDGEYTCRICGEKW